ncbi:hypothetical protein XA68_17634 [Ophiocordyceps unilateralis]|uniref:Uncharacterized protein n=1 Tax=Ophiocordyceps unilateralis TaxID=268505 RepID=A0A2A9PK98_OPHUN|nr:hypothetical protein XA68_17634 [Ophiocordyceps unilateralis]
MHIRSLVILALLPGTLGFWGAIGRLFGRAKPASLGFTRPRFSGFRGSSRGYRAHRVNYHSFQPSHGSYHGRMPNRANYQSRPSNEGRSPGDLDPSGKIPDISPDMGRRPNKPSFDSTYADNPAHLESHDQPSRIGWEADPYVAGAPPMAPNSPRQPRGIGFVTNSHQMQFPAARPAQSLGPAFGTNPGHPLGNLETSQGLLASSSQSGRYSAKPGQAGLYGQPESLGHPASRGQAGLNGQLAGLNSHPAASGEAASAGQAGLTGNTASASGADSSGFRSSMAQAGQMASIPAAIGGIPAAFGQQGQPGPNLHSESLGHDNPNGYSASLSRTGSNGNPASQGHAGLAGPADQYAEKVSRISPAELQTPGQPPMMSREPGFWKSIGSNAAQGIGGNAGVGVGNAISGGLGYVLGTAMTKASGNAAAVPGMGMSGMGMSGMGMSGMGTPGMGTSGTGMPGMELPGIGVPDSSSMPAMPGAPADAVYSDDPADLSSLQADEGYTSRAARSTDAENSDSEEGGDEEESEGEGGEETKGLSFVASPADYDDRETSRPGRKEKSSSTASSYVPKNLTAASQAPAEEPHSATGPADRDPGASSSDHAQMSTSEGSSGESKDLKEAALEPAGDSRSLASQGDPQIPEAAEQPPRQDSNFENFQEDRNTRAKSSALTQNSTFAARSRHPTSSRGVAANPDDVENLNPAASPEGTDKLKKERKVLIEPQINSGLAAASPRSRFDLVARVRNAEEPDDNRKELDLGQAETSSTATGPVYSNEPAGETDSSGDPGDPATEAASLIHANQSNSRMNPKDNEALDAGQKAWSPAQAKDAGSEASLGEAEDLTRGKASPDQAHVSSYDATQGCPDDLPWEAEIPAEAHNSSSAARPNEPQHLQKRTRRPKCGSTYCKRRGWYHSPGEFLAAEADTLEWKQYNTGMLNWSDLVVEDCRWDGQPPVCGIAEELSGVVEHEWTLIADHRLHSREVCDDHFSPYYSGKDCCEKFNSRNPCRRGYRRLWCRTKNPFKHQD